MQFKNPEVFYFLVLLIIPILVHLFQLQKFRKVAFTNVAFLKKISLETRKSSKLKKWLILCIRSLGLLAILFVFSQPYFSENKSDQKTHNFIYLDNSLSLNTNGSDGNQLKIAAQKIIENTNDLDLFTLLTNDEIYEEIDKIKLSEVLKSIKFSTKSSQIDKVLLQIATKLNNTSNYVNNTILISDYQLLKENKNKVFTNVNTPILSSKLINQEKNNISIEKIIVENNSSDEILLNVIVRNQGEAKSDIPIALYNDQVLVSKRSFSIEQDSNEKILFTIPKTTKFLGELQITYNDIFLYDNRYYFHLSTANKVNILSIGNTSNALQKIYQDKSFNFQNSTLQKVNYSSIPEQQLIILNELQNIPNVLISTLEQFIQNGGHLLIIPSSKIDIGSYNLILQKLGSGKITGIKNDSLKITNINFDHPLYSNVFSKRVSNFQYPHVSKYYKTNLKGSKIISFENNLAFLQEMSISYSNVYWFSSPLSNEVTNFSNSPLIVPTLYNIGQQSLKTSKPSYTLQEENTIEINEKVGKDDILSIYNNSESFIPLQQSFSNKVRITTKEQPKSAGFYSVLLKNDTIERLAFNVSKEESNLDFLDLNDLQETNSNLKIYDSIESLFGEINEKNEVQWLWKLFLVIAIVSLLTEILILKFFKT